MLQYSICPTDGSVCPVGIALPTRHIRGSFVRLEDAEDHACPGVVQVAEWIRNFTDMSAGNCTFKFRWRGELKYYCTASHLWTY